MFNRTHAAALTAACAFTLYPHPAHAAALIGDAALTVGGASASVTVTAPAPMKETVTVDVALTGLDGYALATVDTAACVTAAPNAFTCTFANSKEDIAIPVTLTPAAQADLYDSETVTGHLTAADATGTQTLPVTVTGNVPDPSESTPEPSGPLTPTPAPSDQPSEEPSEPVATETVTETATVYEPGATVPSAAPATEYAAPGVTDWPTTEAASVAPAAPAFPTAAPTAEAPDDAFVMPAAATAAGGGVNWWATAGVGAAALAAATGAVIIKRRRAKAAAEPTETESPTVEVDGDSEKSK